MNEIKRYDHVYHEGCDVDIDMHAEAQVLEIDEERQTATIETDRGELREAVPLDQLRFTEPADLDDLPLERDIVVDVVERLANGETVCLDPAGETSAAHESDNADDGTQTREQHPSEQPQQPWTVPKLRPPVKWHGGKYYLARPIIELFPEHQTYVEPFGGAASVLLNKHPSQVEVYNDLDHRITRLFRVLRDHGEELQERLQLTPYSAVEFNDCNAQFEDGEEVDEIEAARRDFVLWRQSIGGRGDSFSETLHRVRREMADVVSGYLSSIDAELPSIIERLRCVQIVQRPAVEVITKWDSPETLFYCDPPYVPETRNESSRDVYGVEMSDDDHRALAEVLNDCKGKVIVSGYDCDLYSELFGGWRKESFEIANHAAGGSQKARMTEVLWLNF